MRVTVEAKQRFGKARRLKGKKAFSRVFGGRHSAANKLIVIYAAANDLPYPRLGLTVGRRHGNAVRRNRLKRLLREAFRIESESMPVGFDLVCIPKVGHIGTLEAYMRSIPSVADRASARCAAKAKQ